MTLLWIDGLAITVHTDAQGGPLHFDWQGRRHTRRRIVQSWEIDVDWWTEHGRIHREYWALITTAGLLCVLYRDCLCNEWRLVRLYD